MLKNSRIIFLSLTLLILIVIIGSYYLLHYGKQINPVQQRLSDGNFSDFLAQKKKLSSIKEPMPPTTTTLAYFWDGDKKVFDKTSFADRISNDNPNTTTEQADLNGNRLNERYDLKDGGLTITENSELIWQSPADWWIDSFKLADSNNDGITDINLSVWKSGDYGTSKPFWIKKNDLSVKNHFFIFDLVQGSIKSVWQSSNLEAPNCEFEISDVNSDGKNELVVIEGDYSKIPKCDGKYIAVWLWNGWGFANEWRSEPGNFSGLKIEKIDDIDYIITNSY